MSLHIEFDCSNYGEVYGVGDLVLIRRMTNVARVVNFYSYMRKTKSVNRVSFENIKTKSTSSKPITHIERHATQEEIKAGRRLS